MAERKSIYIGRGLARALAQQDLFGGTTGMVNVIGDRYAEICRRERPELTLDEWCAVCDALNGVWSFQLGDDGAANLPALMPEIHDAPGLSEKWEVDVPRICAILNGLSFAGRIAVIDLVERFWARSEDRRAPRVIMREVLNG